MLKKPALLLIELLIGIYDVLNNPLMGAAYDHTRTRWGKARPYILATPLPYFLSTAIMYCGALIFGDTGVNDPKKIIFLFSLLRLKILMMPTLTGAVRQVIKSSLTAISKLLTGLYLQIISIFIFMSMASCLVRLE